MRIFIDIPDEVIKQIPSATYARETAQSAKDEINERSGLQELNSSILTAVAKGSMSTTVRVPRSFCTRHHFDGRPAEPGEAFLSASGLVARDLLIWAGYKVQTFVKMMQSPYFDVHLAMTISWDAEVTK